VGPRLFSDFSAHNAEVEGSSPSLTTKSMGYDCSSLAFSGILRDCGAQIQAPWFGTPIIGPDQGDLRAFLKVCGAVRDHVKALVKANLASWALSSRSE
jgi:hypothetical protein